MGEAIFLFYGENIHKKLLMFLYIQIINFHFFIFLSTNNTKLKTKNKNIFHDLILCARELQAFKREIL